MLTALLAFAFGSAIVAQQPGPAVLLSSAELGSRSYLGMGYRWSYFPKGVILDRPGVQAEIKLTEKQKSQIRAVEQELERKMAEATQDSRAKLEEYKKTKEQRGEQYDLEELGLLARAVDDGRLPLIRQREPLILNVLDRRQLARLQEIQMQLEGPLALSRPEIQEKLNMDPEQIQLISEILGRGKEEFLRVSEISPELASAFRMRLARKDARTTVESKEFKESVDKARTAVLDARRATMREIGKLLTKKQRTNFDKILGEPISPDKLSLTWTTNSK